MTPSFPKRRSSYLYADVVNNQTRGSPSFDKLLNHGMMLVHPPDDPKSESAGARAYLHTKEIHIAIAGKDHAGIRSEEHTSELQSLMRISYAVFCLQKQLNNHYNPRLNIYLI